MRRLFRPNRRQRRLRRGLSLIEVSISTLLVGLVLVGSMRTLGHVLRSRGTTSIECRADALAAELLTEILDEAYEDAGGSPVFGRESGESGGDRVDFDDVDDYHGWSSTPPEDRSGIALPNSTNWQRDVTVEFVEPNSPSTVSGTDQGLKRVTVTVRLSGTIVAESFSLACDNYLVP